MSDTDTAFVDLIEEQPAPREKFPSYTDERIRIELHRVRDV